MIPKGNPNPSANRERDDFPGYPHYDTKEDIYKNANEQQNIDPERPDREKKPNVSPEKPIKAQEAGEFIEGSNQPGSQEFPDGDEGDNDDDDDLGLVDDDDLNVDGEEKAISRGKRAGEDLDVPGAELDDDQEALGSEDEENNYYSLGGDNHEA